MFFGHSIAIRLTCVCVFCFSQRHIRYLQSSAGGLQGRASQGRRVRSVSEQAGRDLLQRQTKTDRRIFGQPSAAVPTGKRRRRGEHAKQFSDRTAAAAAAAEPARSIVVRPADPAQLAKFIFRTNLSAKNCSETDRAAARRSRLKPQSWRGSSSLIRSVVNSSVL